MITMLQADQANCPRCFNETLDELRSIDGVRSVHGSLDGPCIEIVHDGVGTEVLIATARTRLHGIDMLANEVVMVPVDPTVAACCAHHQHD